MAQPKKKKKKNVQKMMKKSLPTMCLMAHVESAIMYLQYRVDPLNWNNVFGFFKSYHVNVNSHSHLTNFKLNYYFSTQKAILINSDIIA